MKLKNKILIILFIIIFLFLILNNNSYAATTLLDSLENIDIPNTDITWKDIEKNLTETQISKINEYSFFILNKIDSELYQFVFFNDYTIVIDDYYNPPRHDMKPADGSSAFRFYIDSGKIDNYYSNFTSQQYLPSFFLSNTDIIDTDGTVLFQQPPQVGQTILAPIVEETETQKTLAEVVGILPLIIVVVVSLVGLRKALRMLLALLHCS